MSTTPLFGIEELPASSSQPEIYVNTATRILEAMAQLRFADRDTGTPPGSPAEGDTYLIAGSPTGAWVGRESQIAIYVGTAWKFVTPLIGFRAYVIDEDIYIRHVAGSPSGWIQTTD